MRLIDDAGFRATTEQRSVTRIVISTLSNTRQKVARFVR